MGTWKNPDYPQLYYVANRERILAKQRERYYANQEEKKRRGRASYHKHREKRLAYGRLKYQENKEKFRLYGRRRLPLERERRRNLRQEIIKKYGGKCMRCGFLDERALQIDHIIGGNGWREHRDHTFYRRVLADTSNAFQILCANCNWIKAHEQKECRNLQ